MGTLTLQNMHKYYGSVHAINGVELTIPEGEFTVLVGPSGCGKSTLLRSIAGLETISQGEILIDSRPVTRLRPRDRNLAMVFQSYALYPYLTVYENIAFGLPARKTPKREIDKRVRNVASRLSIDSLLDRLPRELSGGQRQRVAIGRAIVREADLYLFDEPLSNLDAKLREEMREELKRLHGDLGKTFIYVTHDQIEAMTLADRIVLLHEGIVEQSGTPLDLFERPVNRFVAGFLGAPSMNFIPVDVDRSASALVLPDGQRVALSASQLALDLSGHQRLIWGLRPEHFHMALADEPGLDVRPGIDVKIEVMQPTGSRTYGSFSIGATRAVAELDPHAVTGSNRNVRLRVAMDRTSLFDPETDMALYPSTL
ncbi:MAG: hypothetical protein ETSY2_40505 [Candidatus Entotheonella gemina]|uniref:ABC transporter domain-containing protein n=1 Tax=Candidatus Entotheonella gemina TaxID=1429439 RepID=W4LQE1_9BACT|nr:MAG: hypothetical protein ETSY2_40505 [Candidatus Entotheonella gemina]